MSLRTQLRGLSRITRESLIPKSSSGRSHTIAQGMMWGDVRVGVLPYRRKRDTSLVDLRTTLYPYRRQGVSRIQPSYRFLRSDFARKNDYGNSQEIVRRNFWGVLVPDYLPLVEAPDPLRIKLIREDHRTAFLIYPQRPQYDTVLFDPSGLQLLNNELLITRPKSFAAGGGGQASYAG